MSGNDLNAAKSRYASPLTSRYASTEMSYNFSDRNKFTLFRTLWIALAKAQHSLGLTQVTPEAIKESIEPSLFNLS